MHRRALRRAALGLALGLGVCAPATAAQWSVRPAVDLGAVRDDNIRLTTGPHDTASGYIAAANLEVERETETSRADFAGAAVYSRYSGGDVGDTTEYRAELDAEKQTSERGTLGLAAEYRRDALFKTLVIEEGTGDIRDVDVGISTEEEVRRYYRVVEPSWRWLLSELSSVRFSYRLTDASFSDAARTVIVDYEEDLLNATYARQWTSQNDFYVTVNASRYRPEGDANESDTLRLLAGVGRAFSETLRGTFALGASRTDETGVAQEGRTTGVVVTATLRQRSELSTLEGVVSRDVTPSGIGRALRTDQVRVYWARRTSPRTELVFDAQWLETRVIEGTDPSVERRYYELSPQLRWQWLADTFVVASYRYRYQKFRAAADSADSSAVFLGVSYSL